MREKQQGAQGRGPDHWFRGERLPLPGPWLWDAIDWTPSLGPLCSSRKPQAEALPHLYLRLGKNLGNQRLLYLSPSPYSFLTFVVKLLSSPPLPIKGDGVRGSTA